ncbi:RICIN domain-containing protein [Kitasatospora sp. McL0602]|uniref:RICIN domain-containing protein n=1 Tax=Kitasatospora sp. McL0602 TaxID=3439530 RepID=UPI003F899ECF
MSFSMAIGGKQLGLARGSVGAPVLLKSYDPADSSQQWSTVFGRRSGQISLGLPGDRPTCLDLFQSNTSDGTPLKLYDMNWPSTANQGWNLRLVEDLPGSQLPQQYVIVDTVMRLAQDNPLVRANLLANPAQLLADAGYPLQIEQQRSFNRFFREREGLVAALTDGASPEAVAGWQCRICEIGAWTFMFILVSMGAAALAFLTPEAAVVVALATYAGVTAVRALAFIQVVVAVGEFTIDSVLSKLCSWMGVCP